MWAEVEPQEQSGPERFFQAFVDPLKLIADRGLERLSCRNLPVHPPKALLKTSEEIGLRFDTPGRHDISEQRRVETFSGHGHTKYIA